MRFIQGDFEETLVSFAPLDDVAAKLAETEITVTEWLDVLPSNVEVRVSGIAANGGPDTPLTLMVRLKLAGARS